VALTAVVVAAPARTYERHRLETTALYGVVRENLETLYGAIDDGALGVKLPKHAKKELDAYLDCGLLCQASRGSSATNAPRVGWWLSRARAEGSARGLKVDGQSRDNRRRWGASRRPDETRPQAVHFRPTAALPRGASRCYSNRRWNH
jgi:hypothetical protein